MQYLTFISCIEGRKIEEFDMLGDDGNDEDGSAFQINDEVVLDIDINPEIAAALKSANFPGIRINEPSTDIDGKVSSPHSIALPFIVKNRSHTISTDWIGRNRDKSLRISDHTIQLKPQSEVVESIFLWVRIGTKPEWMK